MCIRKKVVKIVGSFRYCCCVLVRSLAVHVDNRVQADEPPDFSHPSILDLSNTVSEFCRQSHRTLTQVTVAEVSNFVVLCEMLQSPMPAFHRASRIHPCSLVDMFRQGVDPTSPTGQDILEQTCDGSWSR